VKDILQSVIVPVTHREILAGIWGLINNGSRILEFERLFSKYVDCEYVIPTSSGSSALYILFKAYGLKKGDEVIVPAYICEKVVRLVLDMGYRVKFVDVDIRTYNLSISDLSEKISRNTRAVIAAHMFGNPCEMKEIVELAHDHGAIVLEDSAQCIGAEYRGKKVGSLGDSAFFSFGEGKPITTIAGGAITTNDKRIADKSRSIANKFRSSKKSILLAKLIMYSLIKNRVAYSLLHGKIQARRKDRWSELKKTMDLSSLELAFTSVQASVGIAQLKNLEHFNEIRYKNAKFLIENLKKVEELQLPSISPRSKPFFLRFPIYIKTLSIKQFLNALTNSGVDASRVYPNYLPSFFNIESKCPNARELARKTITLPVHPCVKGRDLQKMVDVIKKVVGGHKR